MYYFYFDGLTGMYFIDRFPAPNNVNLCIGSYPDVLEYVWYHYDNVQVVDISLDPSGPEYPE